MHRILGLAAGAAFAIAAFDAHAADAALRDDIAADYKANLWPPVRAAPSQPRALRQGVQDGQAAV